MGICYRLCPRSAKRLGLLEEDPGLVSDLAEGVVPDVLDLGEDGFELDWILLFAARDSAIRDAVFAQTGRDLSEPAEGVRVHTPERVRAIHEALRALPDDIVSRNFEAARGVLGKRLKPGAKSVEHFRSLFERLRALYAKAAADGHGMLTFMV